jgi:hypothetical protein
MNDPIAKAKLMLNPDPPCLYGPLEYRRVIAGLLERQERMEGALRIASTALDDWLSDYAAEFCNEDRVKEARERINAHGTIGYIGDVQQVVRAALCEGGGE